MAAALVLVTIIITILSLIFIWIAHFTKWDCSELLDFGAEHRAVSRLSRNVNQYQTVTQNDVIDDEKDNSEAGASNMSEEQLKDVVDAIPDSDHEN